MTAPRFPAALRRSTAISAIRRPGQPAVGRIMLCVDVPGRRDRWNYTLSATSLALTELQQAVVKRLPRYPAVPATLMGRLAVDQRRRGQRLGELLLFDTFSRALRSDIATFAFIVDAKDDSAQAFYERYRFVQLPSAGRRLFLPLAEIAALFA